MSGQETTTISTPSMQMPERLLMEELNPNHAKFVMQPLEEGYGVTIGNSFRRVLLSSTPGCAIVGVKIGSVLHEFSTIQGVVEDMTEIILNLKEIRLKIDDKRQNRLIFHLKGPCIWTARDIENADPNVTVMEPDHYIATLAEDAEFDVELKIGYGKGYVPAEEQVTADYPIGMIPIDSIYTPIKNVVYHIEPFRVGQKTDYERLTLDVLTDGTIAAKEAVQDAAHILRNHIELFTNFADLWAVTEEPDDKEQAAREVERKRVAKLMRNNIEDLEVSVRCHNCLKAANIRYVFELTKLQEMDYLKFRNFGRKSLSELSAALEANGLRFGTKVEEYLSKEEMDELLATKPPVEIKEASIKGEE